MTFPLSTILGAASAEKLLSLEIEFTRLCNYRCPYCYVGEPDTSNEMTPEEISDCIRQAANLGARKIIILGGEPLLYPELETQLALITELGMAPELFTNGALVTPAIARVLAKYQTRTVVKLNSLDEDVQERMTGIPGALDLALKALEILETEGVPLGASSVICSENAAEIPALWRYLRERNITPYFEMMTPQGRLLLNNHLLVPPREIERIFHELAAIDRESGREWEPQPPLAGDRCLRHLYSCLVAADGSVRPCVGIDSTIGNVRNAPLGDILRDSVMMRDFRHFRTMIKEPCRSCEKSASCYGCRGAAFQLTGDPLAADPLCWRNCSRTGEIVTLPCDAKPLLPHGVPISMVGRLLSFEAESFVTADIAPGHPLVTDGELERTALIELAAQAAAAVDSFRHAGKIARGMLVGGSGINIAGTLRAGEKAQVGITVKHEFGEWIFLDFRILRENNEIVAEGELKLCVSR